MEIQLDPNTLYRTNDLVRYNGKVYKATNRTYRKPTSFTWIEANPSDWTILSHADTWRGTWTIGTRYKGNDIVKYGGIVYKCLLGHTFADNITLGLEEDPIKWEIQIDGLSSIKVLGLRK